MHEMSVIAHVIDTLDSFAEHNSIEEIQTVVLQVGVVSGIVPKYVFECWAPAVYFSKHLKKSTVEIEDIPAIGRCRMCGTEYDMKEHEGVCPVCKSNRWEELSGGDFVIKEIRVVEPKVAGQKEEM